MADQGQASKSLDRRPPLWTGAALRKAPVAPIWVGLGIVRGSPGSVLLAIAWAFGGLAIRSSRRAGTLGVPGGPVRDPRRPAGGLPAHRPSLRGPGGEEEPRGSPSPARPLLSGVRRGATALRSSRCASRAEGRPSRDPDRSHHGPLDRSRPDTLLAARVFWGRAMLRLGRGRLGGMEPRGLRVRHTGVRAPLLRPGWPDRENRPPRLAGTRPLRTPGSAVRLAVAGPALAGLTQRGGSDLVLHHSR